uniref:DNA polymerase beta thumb domain-containing protein n=1 Tax=viral metagenome TaxID=1070528 RepID=A0A6C0I036_9ZZZZ
MENLYKYIHYGNKGYILSKKLYNMGYRTRKDLLNHIKSKKLPTLPNISQIYIKYNPIKSTYKKSIDIINILKKNIKNTIIPVGSIRRKEKQNTDIDLLLLTNNKKFKLQCNLNIIFVEGGNRHQKYIFTLDNNSYLIDIFICKKTELPYMLFHYTGNKKYNIRTRAYAKNKGWLLNQYGLWNKKTGKSIAKKKIKTEKDLIKYIGISYKDPKDRIK